MFSFALIGPIDEEDKGELRSTYQVPLNEGALEKETYRDTLGILRLTSYARRGQGNKCRGKHGNMREFPITLMGVLAPMSAHMEPPPLSPP